MIRVFDDLIALVDCRGLRGPSFLYHTRLGGLSGQVGKRLRFGYFDTDDLILRLDTDACQDGVAVSP